MPKLLLFGAISWLVPFVLAFAFYTPEGELAINISTFKAIMVISGGIVGAILFVKYFKGVKSAYLKEGAIAGGAWLAINLLLDILTLVMAFGMSLGDYLSQIGLSYLMIPIMGIAMGAAIENAKKK
ncbi:hypothetical protein JW721_02975 [Candidatus Micrarchaeota archaeon]|nr:hypothetical protein [Candidatus Micrarchaeota archaeon]